MNWLHLFLAVSFILAVRPRWAWFPYDLFVVWRAHRRDCFECFEISRSDPDGSGVAFSGSSSRFAEVTPHTNKGEE